MSSLKIVLKWCLGILFILVGIKSFADSTLVAILSILLGLFLIPPALAFLEKKINYSFPSFTKWIVAIVGIVLLNSAISSNNEDNNKLANELIYEAYGLVEDGNFEEAKTKIENAKSKYNQKDNRAVELEKAIEESKSLDSANFHLAKLTDENFEMLKKGELENKYLYPKKLNDDLISLMKSQIPNRKQILKEFKEKEEVTTQVA